MACMIRPLADADPVPLAVAILKANSFVRVIDIEASGFQLPASSHMERPPSPRLCSLWRGFGETSRAQIAHNPSPRQNMWKALARIDYRH
jgi:hypothetical protein